MECKICGKTIPRGGGYREGNRFKNEKFCSKECYDKRVQESEKKKKSKTDKVNKTKENKTRKKLTDYLQELYGEYMNWPMIMNNVKLIEEQYDLNDRSLLLVLRYAIKFENYNFSPEYNLYQFVKFIIPTENFLKELNKAEEVLIPEEKIVSIKHSNKKGKWHERT